MVSLSMLLVSLAMSLVLNELVIFSLASSINSIFTSKTVRTDEIEMSSELMESVMNGAEMAFGCCQEIFKWNRWNCPATAFSRRGDEPPTKETAYVLAVTSAAVVHSVSRSCARGINAKSCGCTPKRTISTHRQLPNINDGEPDAENETTDEIWRWSGCPDYLKHGEKVATALLDGLERDNGGLRTRINRHNNGAGRLAIRSTVRRHCRCHGVSGSCSLQTCWLQAAPFSEVASALREEYKHPLRLDTTTLHNSAASDSAVNDFSNIATPSNRLVYLNDSLDYCKPNKANGWPGTRGRACSRDRNATVAARRSCRHLCRSCGYRIRRERRQIISRCNCTFKWCCEVKCDTCKEIVQEFFCE